MALPMPLFKGNAIKRIDWGMQCSTSEIKVGLQIWGGVVKSWGGGRADRVKGSFQQRDRKSVV